MNRRVADMNDGTVLEAGWLLKTLTRCVMKRQSKIILGASVVILGVLGKARDFILTTLDCSPMQLSE